MRQRLRHLLALPLVAALTAAATAQPCRTLIFAGGPIPTTWTAAGSPYCVITNVTIPTLTITPGVDVLVAAACTVTVGNLVVTGIAGSPVTFRARDPVPWNSLVVAAGSSLAHCHVYGAADSGLQLQAAGIRLDHCLIRGNSSGRGGGGVRVELPVAAPGTVTLSDCWVLDNAASGHGGGVWASIPSGATLELVDCQVARNRTNPHAQVGTFNGGGIHATGSGVLSLLRTEVGRNRAESRCADCDVDCRGGGLFLEIQNASLSHSIVRENVARSDNVGRWSLTRSYGGGLYAGAGVGALTIDSCLVSCNLTSGGNVSHGGGLYLNAAATTLIHTTIARNRSENWWQPTVNLATYSALAGFGASAVGTDCIVYGNTVNNASGAQIGGAATFDYSCIEGGFSGNGNIAAGPVFAAGIGCGCAELAIVASSPCVDAGDPVTTNYDASRPPGFGTARGDIGYLGGPRNHEWLRAPETFDLFLYPPQTELPATVSFDLEGVHPGDAAAVFLVGVNRVPYGAFWLDALFGIACASSDWTRDLALPLLSDLIGSVEFQGATLTAGRLLITPPVSLVIRS